MSARASALVAVILNQSSTDCQSGNIDNDTGPDHNDAMMINRLYIVFLGLLMAVFVGVGIAAFYHAPQAPDYTAAHQVSPTDSPNPEQEKAIQAEQQAYDVTRQAYDRNVSLLALTAALVLVALGLSLFAPVVIMGDSLLLGGVFTLAYSTIRGFGTDDISRFLIVSASLAVAIAISYLKFIRPRQAASKK
jgi:hypothetical protein